MYRSLKPTKTQLIAICYGIVCHSLFVCAGTLMFLSLYTGFSWQGRPTLQISSYALNLFLLLQFPFFHSFLLSSHGKHILRIFYSSKFQNKLDTTIYASLASLQLIILFLFWKPSGILIWVAPGYFFYVLTIVYLISWLGLSVSSFQAGYSVQTGSLGWTSLLKGTKIKFPDMPTHGLFKIIRHPIYFSFCLVLWVSPFLTVDKIVIGTFYVLYCIGAPKLKERRFLNIYGERFEKYRSITPYFFPKLFRLNRNSDGK